MVAEFTQSISSSSWIITYPKTSKVEEGLVDRGLSMLDETIKNNDGQRTVIIRGTSKT